jgi:hypothetical protein
VIKRKPKIPPVPPPSRLDRLSDIELYETMESSLGEVHHLLSDFRTDGTDREMKMALVELHLETALLASRSMRRRVAIT